MDSQSTEVNSQSLSAADLAVTNKELLPRGTKRRRSSGDSCSLEDNENEADNCSMVSSKKRRESIEESSPNTSRLDESGYQSDSSQHEMFHPAFRGSSSTVTTTSNSNDSETTAAVPGQTMEIDQITSLVSIFSFGQHIMAAAAAAKATGGQGPSPETNPEEEEEEEEEEDKKAKNNSSEDSDSESDTSSDSGHSSDDHEAVAGGKEDNASSSASSTTSTKLTRSVSTPDLCATSAAISTDKVSVEAPPCVEVASL